ncbi:C40 family peptidase [Qingshengfaniella alkalisoli]|uniref:NlpC/P60 family protein n=1 Tax=Qingshengfaniella alkalisoli TaxID=2599296 RepID=A0A5B8IY14_9RHOB|nr:NlpC/P60 family protein [Qingshengfaniella alkalisoli]QDY69781.1 NlpC/P60 family protein [Qingshengfaniella alkalisoli]
MTQARANQPTPLQVVAPVADVLDRPNGARIRQMLYGETGMLLEEADGYRRVRATKDGYVGYVRADRLGEASPATHKVLSLATHLYTKPDFKSKDAASLSFGSQVTVLDRDGAFSRVKTGHFIPTVHLAPARAKFGDPAAIAELFLGTPYLWGGNSRLGIDCSGLVQTAALACGVPCPGDTGDQVAELGHAVPTHASLQRGDVIFWEGHVAMMVNERRIIHANAHHMSVAFEPLNEAIKRIAEQGDGDVIARRRMDLR